MWKWHPIDTAPKDGREVLLGEPEDENITGEMVVARWDVLGNDGWHTQERFDLDWPTHWAELPDPPQKN